MVLGSLRFFGSAITRRIATSKPGRSEASREAAVPSGLTKPMEVSSAERTNSSSGFPWAAEASGIPITAAMVASTTIRDNI